MVRDPLPIGSHGKIMARRIKPKRWMARVYFRDSAGVRREVTAQGPTRAAAEHRVKLKLSNLPVAGAELSSATTLREALERWVSGLDDGLALNTLRNYKLWAERLSQNLGSLLLRELTAGALDAYLAGIDLPSVRYNQRLTLKMALDEAVRLGALPHNPVLATRPVKTKKKEVRALDLEQVQELRRLVSGLQATPTYSGYLPDLVDVLLGTGCRWGEGAGIRWQDVDLEAGTVTICGTLVQKAAGRLIRRLMRFARCRCRPLFLRCFGGGVQRPVRAPCSCLSRAVSLWHTIRRGHGLVGRSRARIWSG